MYILASEHKRKPGSRCVWNDEKSKRGIMRKLMKVAYLCMYVDITHIWMVDLNFMPNLQNPRSLILLYNSIRNMYVNEC